MLEVKLLEAGAKLPTVATPGEDLGYDVYALEDAELWPGQVTLVRTGIAVAAYRSNRRRIMGMESGIVRSFLERSTEPLGLIIKDRSSMASKGIITHGGVIDAGYRGEVKILMRSTRETMYRVQAGDKIAQMVPVPVLTGEIFAVGELSESNRGDKGFGSSGE